MARRVRLLRRLAWERYRHRTPGNSSRISIRRGKGGPGDRVLTIVKAQNGPNIDFAIRDPGKLWEIDHSRALVVCGAGTVWIDEAVDVDARPIKFTTLRARFLTAENAWIVPFIAKQ